MCNKASSKYQQCTRCIMDNSSDDTITFDLNGCCNYCSYALKIKDKVYFPNEIGENKLKELIARLKRENKNNKYDCLMGISGGLDSSYLAYLGSVKWGLRILAVHVDDGFNSEISNRNIKRISDFPNLKLEFIRPDSAQYKSLIKAYMYACVPNLAVPQDNILFASIYKYMRANKISSFLSGGNFALENIIQVGNTHTAFDIKNIKFINGKFGTLGIDKLELISEIRKDLDTYVMGVKTYLPLNFLDYNRERAIQELKDYCSFEYYGSKHLENDLTKFIQQYWFYNKFGVDKRASHLSSMIVSDQLTRTEALSIYNAKLYDDEDMRSTVTNVLKRLDVTDAEFKNIMSLPAKQHVDYPCSLYNILRKKGLGFLKLINLYGLVIKRRYKL